MPHKKPNRTKPTAPKPETVFTAEQLARATEAACDAVDIRVAIIRSEHGTISDRDIQTIKGVVQSFFKGFTTDKAAIGAFKKIKPSESIPRLQHEMLKESLMVGLESLHVDRRQLGMPSRFGL